MMDNVIQLATRDCARSDCRLTVSGGTATCVAWTPTYDKNGNQVGGGDPNTWSRSARCHTCGQEWSVATQYGETTVTKRATQAPTA